MAERCPTCGRPFAGLAVYDEDHECPNSPSDHPSMRDELACLRLGMTVRDAQLERARALLARVGQTLDDAIDQLPAEVTDV